MNNIKILICFFLLLSASELFSQSRIGIYAGLNSGKLSGDSPGKFKYVSSLNLAFGLAYDLQLKEDVYLSFQTSYANAGSKMQHPKVIDEEEVLEDSISIEMHLVSVPIFLKLISDNKKFQFSGGFEMSYPIKFTADNSEEKTDLSDIDIFDPDSLAEAIINDLL
jgi:hypothetical protein